MKDSRVLRWGDDVTVRLLPSAEIEIRVAGRRFQADERSLSALAWFARPRPLGEVMDQLEVRGPQDYIEMSGAVLALERAGALVSVTGSPSHPAAHTYGAPAIHVAMLDDVNRTRAFLEAIGEVVRPGDVVIDLGTGT